MTPGGERVLYLTQLRLDAVDDGQRVLAVAHDDDAADHLTAAVELRDAPPDVRAETHLPDVGHPDRRASRIGAEGDRFDVGGRCQVAPPAHHVLPTRELQEPARDIVIARLDRPDHVAHGEVVRGELVRIEVDLVLLHEPANTRHFRHARDTRQPKAQVPVLEAPEVRQIVLARLIHQRIFEDPSHAGRVRPNHRVDPVRQLSTDALEILDDPAPGPVHVGPVLEDDVDVRDPEGGKAAHRPHPRRRDEG